MDWIDFDWFWLIDVFLPLPRVHSCVPSLCFHVFIQSPSVYWCSPWCTSRQSCQMLQGGQQADSLCFFDTTHEILRSLKALWTSSIADKLVTSGWCMEGCSLSFRFQIHFITKILTLTNLLEKVEKGRRCVQKSALNRASFSFCAGWRWRFLFSFLCGICFECETGTESCLLLTSIIFAECLWQGNRSGFSEFVRTRVWFLTFCVLTRWICFIDILKHHHLRVIWKDTAWVLKFIWGMTASCRQFNEFSNSWVRLSWLESADLRLGAWDLCVRDDWIRQVQKETPHMLLCLGEKQLQKKLQKSWGIAQGTVGHSCAIPLDRCHKKQSFHLCLAGSSAWHCH